MMMRKTVQKRTKNSQLNLNHQASSTPLRNAHMSVHMIVY